MNPANNDSPISARVQVAFVIDTVANDTAGTQKQLLETIRRLDRSEFEPQLICLWESPWMIANPLPCRFTVLGYRGMLKADFPKVLRRFAGIIDAQEVDILHTFFEDSLFVTWFAAALAKCHPTLVSSRRDIGLGSINQPWYHALYRLARPLANRRFAGVLVNSEAVRRYTSERELLPPRKIKIHRNGVSLPDLKAHQSVPASMALHPNALWIGLVGSLTPVKRHDLVLRAFARLKQSGSSRNARLLLVGDGPQRGTLEQLARNLAIDSDVHFEGEVRDVSPYLRQLDIGVLCSDREGLSNAILEYMAFGVPVVATRVGGNPELVTAESGVLVPPDDVAGLAASLQTLVASPEVRARMGRTGRLKIEQQYSWERSMSELEDYYRSLLRADCRLAL